jgi:U3 small nucleolar RNA-associated protein 3
MAKKRKATRKSEPSRPVEVDAKDARLTIKTYEDVADSEDEYWANQDRIDLDDDDEPRSKRLKRQEKEDAFLEASDEEILGEESDESDEEEEEAPAKTKRGKKVGARDEDVSDQEERGGQEEEGDEGWWGSSKKEYYDADNIETEADALVCCPLAAHLRPDTDVNCRKKRRRRDVSKPRSWPKCKRPISPLTKVNGLRQKNKLGRKRRS